MCAASQCGLHVSLRAVCLTCAVSLSKRHTQMTHGHWKAEGEVCQRSTGPKTLASEGLHKPRCRLCRSILISLDHPPYASLMLIMVDWCCHYVSLMLPLCIPMHHWHCHYAYISPTLPLYLNVPHWRCPFRFVRWARPEAICWKKLRKSEMQGAGLLFRYVLSFFFTLLSSAMFSLSFSLYSFPPCSLFLFTILVSFFSLVLFTLRVWLFSPSVTSSFHSTVWLFSPSVTGSFRSLYPFIFTLHVWFFSLSLIFYKMWDQRNSRFLELFSSRFSFTLCHSVCPTVAWLGRRGLHD